MDHEEPEAGEKFKDAWNCLAIWGDFILQIGATRLSESIKTERKKCIRSEDSASQNRICRHMLSGYKPGEQD
jgi:hypothetical protein